MLREYLSFEFRIDGLRGFQWDLERIIDDWAFMCIFVGNDFLPHLPSLEIQEGAIDRLIMIYRGLLPHMGGYLTHDGTANLGRVEMILGEIGKLEDGIFKDRHDEELTRQVWPAIAPAPALPRPWAF